jgi:hypothetical protein
MKVRVKKVKSFKKLLYTIYEAAVMSDQTTNSANNTFASAINGHHNQPETHDRK